MKKLFWPAFRRNLAGLLVVWLVLAGLLTWMTGEMYHNFTQRRLYAAFQDLDRAYRTADRDGINGLSAFLSRAAGNLAADARLYLSLRLYYYPSGQELARSHVSWGYLDEGDAQYELMLEDVLDDAGELALARVITEHGADTTRWLDWSYGRYGEVTGILTTGGRLYPSRMVYYFETGVPVVLAEAARPLPKGREVTVTFRSPHLFSQLTDQPRPAALLRQIRGREASVEELLTEYGPGGEGLCVEKDTAPFAYTGTTAMYGLPSDATLPLRTVISFTYDLFQTTLSALLPAYTLTLLLVVALAWWMARAQARSLRRERDLTAAVAHELKTPLALLHSYAEGLSEDIAPEKRAEYLSVIMDESDKLSALVGSLLDLSRLEAGKAEFHPAPVALDEVVREVLRPLERPAEEAGVVLASDLVPCTVSGDRERLERLVSNLCANALRHCTPGGAVRVRLTAEDGRALLRVENDGEAIPEEALPRLFEPFYRTDAARARTSGGTGLGLALVRETAALHGGRCGAENLPCGAAFWCSFPICQSGGSMV